MNRTVLLLLVSICFSPLDAAEKCVEIGGSSNSYSDKTIVCGQRANDIIRNISVSKIRDQIYEGNYSADLKVENNNEVEITIRSLLAKFVDYSGKIVGLCSNDVAEVLEPGSQSKLSIKCPNYKFASAGEKEVSDVLFTATPFSGT